MTAFLTALKTLRTDSCSPMDPDVQPSNPQGSLMRRLTFHSRDVFAMVFIDLAGTHGSERVDVS